MRSLLTLLHIARGIVLLGFVNFFLSLFLWVSMPISKDLLIVSGLFWLLAVPLTSYFLYLGAWRAEKLSGREPRSKFEVLEDIVYVLLAMEASGLCTWLFAHGLMRGTNGRPASHVIALGVSGFVFVLTLRLYQKRIHALSETKVKMPEESS